MSWIFWRFVHCCWTLQATQIPVAGHLLGLGRSVGQPAPPLVGFVAARWRKAPLLQSCQNCHNCAGQRRSTPCMEIQQRAVTLEFWTSKAQRLLCCTVWAMRLALVLVGVARQASPQLACNPAVFVDSESTPACFKRFDFLTRPRLRSLSHCLPITLCLTT